MDWLILDTFDMFSAYYDQPQRIKDIRSFFIENNCEVIFSGYINYNFGISAVVRAKKN